MVIITENYFIDKLLKKLYKAYFYEEVYCQTIFLFKAIVKIN